MDILYQALWRSEISEQRPPGNGIFKRVCEFMNHLSVDSMKVQTKAVWGQQFESWVSAQGLKAYRESNKNKNWRERTPIVLYFLHMLDFY